MGEYNHQGAGAGVPDMEEGQQSGKVLSAVFGVLPPADAPAAPAVPGLLLVPSTASMALAAEVQARARVSKALPVPQRCWSAPSPSQPCRAGCAQELHRERQAVDFQMHSMAGCVTGSFRVPLMGNRKSKSVC